MPKSCDMSWFKWCKTILTKLEVSINKNIQLKTEKLWILSISNNVSILIPFGNHYKLSFYNYKSIWFQNFEIAFTARFYYFYYFA